MNYERLAELATSSTRNTINVAKLFATSFTTQREIEQGRLGLFEKAIVTRKDAYRSILESVEQKEEAEGSKLDTLLGALGLGGLAKGLRGIRGPKSATVVPSTPRVLPTPPQTRVSGRGVIPRTPKLPRGRLAGIPGLNVALTGLDFLQRKQAGQTNIQAGAGSIASTLAAIGTAGLVGTAIGGPIGTIAGLAAGTLAAFGTGSLVDMLTGANRPTGVEERLLEEERRTRIVGKTKFSQALDQFDSILGNLAKLSDYLKTGSRQTGGIDDEIPMNTEGVNPEDIRKAKPLRPDAGPPSPENRMPDASTPGAYGIPGDPTSPRIGEWVGSMPPNIKPASRGVGGQLLEPKTNEVAFQRSGMQTIPSTNYQVAQSSGSGTNTVTSQSSDNVVILDKQPNTIVVNQPVPVGGGGVVNSGPSSYEVATKYAKMISSLTA